MLVVVTESVQYGICACAHEIGKVMIVVRERAPFPALGLTRQREISILLEASMVQKYLWQ